MKRLLLHVCCAPCLSGCLPPLMKETPWERVLPYAPDFSIQLFYYNPNIYPEIEMERRFLEVRKLAHLWGDIPLHWGRYNIGEWFRQSKPMRKEPERGERCRNCYSMRLRETFEQAKKGGFDAVASTLTLSPMKNTGAVNESGEALAKEFKIEYLTTDFKKQDGFHRSVKTSHEMALYRQNYCGCFYSLYGDKEMDEPAIG